MFPAWSGAGAKGCPLAARWSPTAAGQVPLPRRERSHREQCGQHARRLLVLLQVTAGGRALPGGGAVRTEPLSARGDRVTPPWSPGAAGRPPPPPCQRGPCLLGCIFELRCTAAPHVACTVSLLYGIKVDKHMGLSQQGHWGHPHPLATASPGTRSQTDTRRRGRHSATHSRLRGLGRDTASSPASASPLVQGTAEATEPSASGQKAWKGAQPTQSPCQAARAWRATRLSPRLLCVTLTKTHPVTGKLGGK